jgi:hypothetical protein
MPSQGRRAATVRSGKPLQGSWGAAQNDAVERRCRSEPGRHYVAVAAGSSVAIAGLADVNTGAWPAGQKKVKSFTGKANEQESRYALGFDTRTQN